MDFCIKEMTKGCARNRLLWTKQHRFGMIWRCLYILFHLSPDLLPIERSLDSDHHNLDEVKMFFSSFPLVTHQILEICAEDVQLFMAKKSQIHLAMAAFEEVIDQAGRPRVSHCRYIVMRRICLH